MRRLALTVAIFAAPGLPAAAQTADPASGWTVDLGAVARARPVHLGSDRYVVDAAPVVQATYDDRLAISFDDGIKWTAGQIGPFAFGPVVEYRQSFNDDLPRGAFRIDDAVEVGGFSQVKTPIGVVEARLRRAVNGYQGWSGDLAFNTGAQVTPKLELGGQLRLAWADSSFTQEYFGLRPHAARRFGLPQFLDEDDITAGGEFDIAREITPHIRLVMALSADRRLGEMTASTIFQNRNLYVAAVGFTYRWSQAGGAR